MHLISHKVLRAGLLVTLMDMTLLDHPPKNRYEDLCYEEHKELSHIESDHCQFSRVLSHKIGSNSAWS